MSDLEIVKPRYFETWNICLWGDPKFTIVCGKCGVSFKKRLPMINKPRAQCVTCGAINEIPVTVSD